uniref:Uncharacterized protein n=1 Tax=Rhizophora mucronata TaxID=61149 RepID=A0A2P2KRX6_RHIMU
MARLFPACFPPLMTVKEGIGRVISDLLESSAMYL